VEWTLIIAISFSILSLLKLEPIARNSVQNHVSEFDLPQTKIHSVGIQHFQSSETLSSKTPNKAAHAHAAVVEQVGSKVTETEDGDEPVETPLTQTQMQTSPQSQNFISAPTEMTTTTGPKDASFQKHLTRDGLPR